MLFRSVVIMLLTLLLRGHLLRSLFGHVEIDVMGYSLTYMFWTALSFPFLALYNASAALFRSMGNSKVSMIVSLIMSLMNVVGNAILIFGFDMGVAGAAISTLISRIFASITLLILLKCGKAVIQLGSLKSFRINSNLIRRILRIGIPNGLENSVFQVGKLLVQGIIAGLGTSAITANAIAGNIGGLGVLPGSAIGLALITVVGQCIGAEDYDGVKYYTGKLLKATYTAMLVLNALLIVLTPVILKLYNLTDNTAETAGQLMRYHAVLAIFIWPLSFSLPNALRAANDAKYTMMISMASMWVWRIGFSIVLVKIFDMGVLGVWIAMTIDWLFRSICFVIRFKQEKYRTVSLG